MISITVPVNNKRVRLRLQISFVYDTIFRKPSLEIKVLEYMLRNSHGGLYVVKKGYRTDIGKYVQRDNRAVKDTLKRLTAKGLIKNNKGSNLGMYSFHPAIHALLNNHEQVQFNFVNK